MIILLRHGETEFNREQRWQGHKDSLLTPRGRQQAREAAERLAEVPVTRLLSSTLGRAQQTASVVADRLGLAIESDGRLREVGFGDCDGMTEAEIEARWPGLAAWRAEDRWNRASPNGESYNDVRARLADFAGEHDLAARLENANEILLLVGHGRSHAILAGLLLGWPDNWIIETHLENAEPYRLLNGDLVGFDGSRPAPA